ncbi:MAG: cytochrome c3 family protein [Bacteroidota bacterium]
MLYKKIIFATLLVLGLAPLSYGQGLATSKHDFTSAAWNNATLISSNLRGQMCLPCHAPHNTNDTSAGLTAPLWNHRMSAQGTYSVYAGYNMQAVVGQPDGTSKLCLSCHDGTVALENFRTYSTGTTYIGSLSSGVSLTGTDLRNDHPISFTYDQALATADGKLYDPTVALSGLAGGGTIAHDMLEGGTKVQCNSCHDPHNGAGVPHLLIKTNSGSQLCFTCHNK